MEHNQDKKQQQMGNSGFHNDDRKININIRACYNSHPPGHSVQSK